MPTFFLKTISPTASQLAPVGLQLADRTQSAHSGPTGASRPAVGRLGPVGLQRADGVLFLKKIYPA